jgi:hypothetical protein
MFMTGQISGRAVLSAVVAAALLVTPAAAMAAGHGGSGRTVSRAHHPAVTRGIAAIVSAPRLVPRKDIYEGSGNCSLTPINPTGPAGTGICGTNPQEIVWPDGRKEIFVVGTDRAIWHTYQSVAGGSWSPWFSFGGYANDGVWVTFDGIVNGSVLVVIQVRGNNDQLYCQQHTASGWSGWNTNCDPLIF